MSAEAKNLEAISKAIDQHNRDCPYPASEVRMNPFEIERLGWEEIRGLPLVGDPELSTGRFRIVCSGEGNEEEVEEVEAIGTPVEVDAPVEVGAPGVSIKPGALRRVAGGGEFPQEGMALTEILVVDEIERARDWYRDVLGAEVYREYGESVVLGFLGAWLLLVPAGGPTEDKPGVEMAPPADPDRVSRAHTIRVPDCRAAYETLKGRGAEFLTPPLDRGAEVRCFFRDPDGNLFEISEARG